MGAVIYGFQMTVIVGAVALGVWVAVRLVKTLLS